MSLLERISIDPNVTDTLHIEFSTDAVSETRELDEDALADVTRRAGCVPSQSTTPQREPACRSSPMNRSRTE